MAPPITATCENEIQEQITEDQEWTFTTDEGEVIALDNTPINAGRVTYLMVEPALSRVWDTPQEDEAWRDLQ